MRTDHANLLCIVPIVVYVPPKLVHFLTTYLFIKRLIQTSTDLIKENSFWLRNARSRQYHAETTTDTDYAKALVATTPALQNPCCIARKRKQMALAYMWTQIKRSTCVLIDRCNLHYYWRSFEICRVILVPRRQHLINWKWCPYATRWGVVSYR